MSFIPLPDDYPTTEELCECKSENPDCKTCNGKGYYYTIKRRKGQVLYDDEMFGEVSDLGQKPNW
jgi:hypothetical protein